MAMTTDYTFWEKMKIGIFGLTYAIVFMFLLSSGYRFISLLFDKIDGYAYSYAAQFYYDYKEGSCNVQPVPPLWYVRK